MIPSTFDPTPCEQYFELRGRHFHGFSLALNARAYVEELLQHAVDHEFLQGYAKACPVPGAEPRHYAPELIQLDSGCTVIAAIHFRGLSRDFPFVDVSAQSTELPRPLDVGRLASPFLRFRPRAVRVWRPENASIPDNADDDLLVLAAPIPVLLNLPPLANTRRVQLHFDPSLASYNDYQRVHDAVHSRVPDAAEFASPEQRSSLADCASSGAFFRVVVDGSLAGFIAARPESYRCWRGWNIVEEVLHPDFHGQGLAPAMQQLFLRTLDLRHATCVFGTIHARNHRSLKTALRVGRRIVDVGTFLYLD